MDGHPPLILELIGINFQTITDRILPNLLYSCVTLRSHEHTRVPVESWHGHVCANWAYHFIQFHLYYLLIKIIRLKYIH